jgi:hypothetical protein
MNRTRSSRCKREFSFPLSSKPLCSPHFRRAASLHHKLRRASLPTLPSHPPPSSQLTSAQRSPHLPLLNPPTLHLLPAHPLPLPLPHKPRTNLRPRRTHNLPLLPDRRPRRPLRLCLSRTIRPLQIWVRDRGSVSTDTVSRGGDWGSRGYA